MTILTTFEDYIIEKTIQFDVSDLNLNLIEQIAAARLGYQLKDMFLVPYTSYQDHYGDPQVAGLYFQTMLEYQREIYQAIKIEAEKIYNEGLLLQEIALLVLCSDQGNTNLIQASESDSSYKYRLFKFRQLGIKKSTLEAFDYIPIYCEPAAGNHLVKDIDFIVYFIKDNFAVAQVENEAYKLYQMLTKIFIHYYAIEALSYNHNAIISEMNDIHRRLTKDIYKLYGKITDEDIAWVKRLYETQFQVDSKRLQATNKQLALQSSSLERKAQLIAKLKYDWYRKNFQRDVDFDQRLYEDVQNHINNFIIKPESQKAELDRSVNYSVNVTQKYYDQAINGFSNIRSLQQSYTQRKLENELAQSQKLYNSTKKSYKDVFLTQVDQDIIEDYLTKVTFHSDPVKLQKRSTLLQEDKDIQIKRTRTFINDDLVERKLKIQYIKMQPEITEAVQKRDVDVLFKMVKILDEMLSNLAQNTLLYTQISSQRKQLKIMLQKYKIKQ